MNGPALSARERDGADRLDAVDRRLLDEYQRGFPLTSRPYAMIADQLGVTETEVIDRLSALTEEGYVTRVGPVFRCRRAGASTLAAMAVPNDRLEAVAQLISSHPQVNHNYERDHTFNLWFVVTAGDASEIEKVLGEIEQSSGLSVMNLPLVEPYHIDLGFRLW